MTKKISIIIVLSVLILAACKRACKVVKGFNSNGEVEYFTYPNCNDESYYLQQVYYNNGQLKVEGNYKNGQAEGKFRSWAKNGTQTAEWEILEGKEHGFIKCWFDNGVKKREVNLDMGVENGIEKTWYLNGKQKSEGYFKNGKKQGTWKYWSEDGKWKVINYKDDIFHGPTFEYCFDHSGAVNLVNGQYENGIEVGLWQWFDNDSILRSATIYVDGKKEGEALKFYPNKQVKQQGILVNGKYEGEVKHFDKNGKLIKVERFKNGIQLVGNK